MQGFSAIIQNTKQDIDVGKKSLIQALNKLQHIDFPQKSHEESSLGFSPSMNDDRMGPVPPKKVTLLSGQEACKKFKKVIEETIELCNIVKVSHLALSEFPILKYIDLQKRYNSLEHETCIFDKGYIKNLISAFY